jgi:RHS repeat-associated protein
VSAIRQPDGFLRVYWISSGGKLKETYESPGVTPWTTIDMGTTGVSTTSGVSAIQQLDSFLRVYSIAANGNLTETSMAPGVTGWNTITIDGGVSTTSGVSAIQQPDSFLRVYSIAANGNLTETSESPGVTPWHGTLDEHYTFDPKTGNPLTVTDVNGQPTTYQYDSFGRITGVYKPGDPPDYPTLSYSYYNWGTLGKQYLMTGTKTKQPPQHDYIWQKDFFDGLGRVIQTLQKHPWPDTTVASTIVYNSRGLVERKYVAQYADTIWLQDNGYKPPDASWKYTSYVYDGLGRVISTTAADGTVTSSDYSVPWQATVTNPNGYKHRYYYDAFARLTKVEELDASQAVYATTNYTYDDLGNLKRVVDANGNTSTVNYDWMFRKTSASDPDMGTWSYLYDSNSNLLTQTDAKGQTITFSYDALNRLTGRTYPAGSGMTNVTYTYDTTTGGNIGKGRRTGMTDGSGTTAWKYDVLGRIIEKKRTIDGVDYVTGYTYDCADRLLTVTYPSGEVVTQQYAAEDARSLPYSLSGTVAGTLVSSTLYNQLGETTRINLGNATYTTFTYYGLDTSSGYYGRPWQTKTTKTTAGDIQNLTYTWDANGNLTQSQDAVSGQTENFTYDFLDRVTGVSGAYSNTYAYNKIGNITAFNGNSYTYGTKPHAVTAAGTTGYAYDANGNMTRRGSQLLTWDVDNRLIGAASTSGVVDVGAGAIDRSGTVNSAGYTDLDMANPANADGRVTSISLWFNQAATGVRVGTYYLVSGSTYRCRDSATIGSVAAGSKQTFIVDSAGNPLSLEVKAGDLIGWYVASGTLEKDASGAGIRYILGEYIDAGDQASYSTASGYGVSIYAEGYATVVDVGAGAIDRNTTISSYAYTNIDLNNPANADGRLTSIDFWFNSAATNVRVGVFYLVSGTTYKCRSSATIGAVSAGSKKTFTQDSGGNPLSLEIKAGDYIGWTLSTGLIELSGSGGSGLTRVSGEYIDPGDQAQYTVAGSSYAPSICGQGSTPVVQAMFVYDGDGNRVKKTEGGQTILYVNKYYEKNLTTGVVTTHYYLGDKEIAYRKGSTLEYLCQDHLGSTAVTTNTFGTVVARIAYFPFGGTRTVSGTLNTDERFTGQRLDQSGLYYYGARYYDATIGRFISADTVVPGFRNPQSLNRYSYCWNNPLGFTDPTGHWGWSNIKKWCGDHKTAIIVTAVVVVAVAAIVVTAGGAAPIMAAVSSAATAVTSAATTAATAAMGAAATVGGAVATVASRGTGVMNTVVNAVTGLSEASPAVASGATTTLYSGGPAALQAANLAAQRGGTTLAMTPAGQSLTQTTASSIVDQASLGFVQNASGAVRVFMTWQGLWNERSTFWRVEFDALCVNPNITQVTYCFDFRLR